MNGLWDVVFAQQASKECFGCLSITVFLQKDVEHGALFIHRPPEPVFDSTNDNMHLIQMPPGTPSGFPVAQFLSQAWGKFDVPLAKGFMVDMNSSLVEQLLNVTLAEREAVIKPQSIPNDTQRKTVTIGLLVSHSLAAYQRLVARTRLGKHFQYYNAVTGGDTDVFQFPIDWESIFKRASRESLQRLMDVSVPYRLGKHFQAVPNPMPPMPGTFQFPIDWESIFKYEPSIELDYVEDVSVPYRLGKHFQEDVRARSSESH